MKVSFKISSEELGLHVFFWKNNGISVYILLIFLSKTVKTGKKIFLGHTQSSNNLVEESVLLIEVHSCRRMVLRVQSKSLINLELIIGMIIWHDRFIENLLLSVILWEFMGIFWWWTKHHFWKRTSSNINTCETSRRRHLSQNFTARNVSHVHVFRSRF